jgi:secondary thiamine-phosphate synthase enzyme
MMAYQDTLEITTRGRGFYNLDQSVLDVVRKGKISAGLCHIYIPHTSASIIISENADPTVLKDLEAFLSRLVPDGDAIFQHIAEGKDDMPAHGRSVLTQTSVTVPIVNHDLALGTWQGIFLWEHRLKAHRRHILVTLLG